MIDGEYVWGSPDIFHKQELAAHRRYIIKHILGVVGPLQMMQVVHHLSAYEGCKAPVNKDLVKLDIEALQEAGEIRRTQGRKYALIER